MQLQPTQLNGYLGAIMLSAGLASSITLAQEPTETAEETKLVQTIEEQPAPIDQESTDARDQKTSDDMVEVRISMPDGRTIIRRERAHQSSARRSFPSTRQGSRILADGSRISYAHGVVTGGSNSSSAYSGGVRSGGGAASSGGGSSGGSSASIKGAASPEVAMGDLESSIAEGSSAQSSSGGTYAGVAASTFSSGSSSTGSSSPGSSSASGASAGSSSSSAGHAVSPRAVHTVGGARYNQEGATGGQRVEFYDAGMSAAVIGNTVYFIGVELVQSDHLFEVVTGTRIGADSVIMEDLRLPAGINPLSSWNTGASTIRLEFESNEIVNLVMHSQPSDSSNPDRVQRTWTVRIR